MIHKKRSIKKILIFTWLLIAIPTFTLTVYFDRNSGGYKKKDTLFKNEINQSIQDTSTSISFYESSNGRSNSIDQIAKKETKNPPLVEKEFSNAINHMSTLSSLPIPTSTNESIIQILTPLPTPTYLPTLEISQSPTIKKAFVKIEGLGNYEVNIEENDTAFSVLQRVSWENNFTINYQNYDSLGVFIKCIASICSNNQYYWAFYYNDQYSTIGSSSQLINNNDITTWKFEKH